MRGFFRLPKRPSDDELVERARRQVRSSDRYGVWFSILAVAKLAAYVWCFCVVTGLVMDLVQQANVPFVVLGFVLGAGLGLILSFPVYGTVHEIVSLIGMMRIQRLMLMYHDALRSVLATASEENNELWTEPSAIVDRQGATTGVSRSTEVTW